MMIFKAKVVWGNLEWLLGETMKATGKGILTLFVLVGLFWVVWVLPYIVGWLFLSTGKFPLHPIQLDGLIWLMGVVTIAAGGSLLALVGGFIDGY